MIIDYNLIFHVVIGVILVGLLYIAATALLSIIKGLRPGATATGNAFLDALTSYAYEGIAGADRIALSALKNGQGLIDGLDRAAIAYKIYDTLPDTIWVGKIPLPLGIVKSAVTRDQFKVLVDNLFAQMDARIQAFEKTLTADIPVPVSVPKTQATVGSAGANPAKTYGADAAKTYTGTANIPGSVLGASAAPLFGVPVGKVDTTIPPLSQAHPAPADVGGDPLTKPVSNG